MTENSDAGRDWDDDLQNLVNGVLDDGREDVPEDVVDMGETGSEDAGDSQPVQSATGDKDIAELLAERTLDLQRLQAEYINYKRRVDRDRDVARQRGIESVLSDLLPVLDGIDAARAHGELTGGAAMLADEVAKVAGKYGLVSFGKEGDPFNPHLHEALMHMDKPGYPVQSVAQVFQKGYEIGERVIRPARVGVADADPDAANEEGPSVSSEAPTDPGANPEPTQDPGQQNSGQ